MEKQQRSLILSAINYLCLGVRTCEVKILGAVDH